MYVDWDNFRETVYATTRDTYKDMLEREETGESAAGVRGFQAYRLLPMLAVLETMTLPVVFFSSVRAGERSSE